MGKKLKKFWDFGNVYMLLEMLRGFYNTDNVTKHIFFHSKQIKELKFLEYLDSIGQYNQKELTEEACSFYIWCHKYTDEKFHSEEAFEVGTLCEFLQSDFVSAEQYRDFFEKIIVTIPAELKANDKRYAERMLPVDYEVTPMALSQIRIDV